MKTLRSTAALCLLAISTCTVAADLSGAYTVEGSNPDGTPYRGTLQVAPAGDAWNFDWLSGANATHGIGVTLGPKIAVAVGGAACAVVLYRVERDGSLQGVWTVPQGGAVGSETATPTAGGGLANQYTVEGRNQAGGAYRGTLRVAQEGEHWRLSWNVGTQYEGYGLERDGYVGVSWGSPDCGVVLYQQGRDGWSGDWKYYRSAIGSERVAR
jgi:hypothetical protein